MKSILAVAAIVALAAGAGAEAPRWRDTYRSRVEMLAVLQTLNAELLASKSATVPLERWCGEHRMASDPRIVALRDEGEPAIPTSEQLARLGVASAAEVQHRRVRLQCGAHVLSEADNWYVPARLTDEMNRLLTETDAPFGRVVRPLEPYRRTVSAEMLWTPLPRGWERAPRPRDRRWKRDLVDVPGELFVHRAVLYTKDHVPIAEVVERYQDDVLAFERPRN